MIAPFDVFRADPNGSPVWIEAFADMDAAAAKAKELAAKPGEYFIFDQTTGERFFVAQLDVIEVLKSI
jgi:hypothetical protein